MKLIANAISLLIRSQACMSLCACQSLWLLGKLRVPMYSLTPPPGYDLIRSSQLPVPGQAGISGVLLDPQRRCPQEPAVPDPPSQGAAEYLSLSTPRTRGGKLTTRLPARTIIA